jgi:hypothetical protein
MRALGEGSVASVVGVALTVAWIALWVAFGLTILTGLAYSAILALSSAGVIDPASLGGEQSFRIGVDGSRLITYDNIVEAWPIAAPGLVIGTVLLGGSLIIVGRLRRLFDSFTSGEPFRRENANHLRAIWITMLGIEIARYVLLGVIAGVFAAGAAPEGADANFAINIDVSTWMSIAVLIVLAEVFREGARLKEEQEFTI